jgi:hypothetical protein
MKRIRFDDDGNALPAPSNDTSAPPTKAPRVNQPRAQPQTRQPQPQSRQPQSRQPQNSRWKFETDFSDHFETPVEAVQHIKPVLQELCRLMGKTPATLRIYDPFYCTGSIVQHFRSIGFTHVHHANRDFYMDVRRENVPDYDVMVTNPPYSADHKEQVLQYVVASGKPWLLLLPNYVSTKSYYTELPFDSSNGPFYVVPNAKYEYSHPEGVFRESSPFFSLWYVHAGKHQRALSDIMGREYQEDGAWWCPDVEQLKAGGAVRDGKRPNPKQRKKMKQRMMASMDQ